MGAGAGDDGDHRDLHVAVHSFPTRRSSDLAAHALGYAATWLTEWYAYDARTRAAFGLAEDERIVGFVHIGTLARPQEDRPRPALGDIVTRF